MNVDFEKTLKFRNYLSKFVNVKTVDRRVHEGWLRNIDPITGNLVLLTFSDDNSYIKDSVLIMGDAYVDVEFIKDADEVAKQLLQNVSGLETHKGDVNLKDRKNRLIAWIKKRKLPVEENSDASLTVCASVLIFPPYEPENCACENLVILEKIMDLIRSMPGDSKDD